MKCRGCKKPNRKSLLFAFRDGQIIYACTKHAGTIPKDSIANWMRIGKLKEVK